MEPTGKIRVNGIDRPCAGQSVAELLRELGMDPGGPGLAVAVAGEVVPRREWSRRELRNGDAVEIVGATQGG